VDWTYLAQGRFRAKHVFAAACCLVVTLESWIISVILCITLSAVKLYSIKRNDEKLTRIC
jgi:hypothetical protein